MFMKATELRGFAPSPETLMPDRAAMNMKMGLRKERFSYQNDKSHAKPRSSEGAKE